MKRTLAVTALLLCATTVSSATTLRTFKPSNFMLSCIDAHTDKPITYTYAKRNLFANEGFVDYDWQDVDFQVEVLRNWFIYTFLRTTDAEPHRTQTRSIATSDHKNAILEEVSYRANGEVLTTRSILLRDCRMLAER